jgi:hypothetical protein
VRTLAFNLQAELEMVLRNTDDVLKSKSTSSGSVQEAYKKCVEDGAELGRLVETSAGSRGPKLRAWRLWIRRYLPARAQDPPKPPFEVDWVVDQGEREVPHP